MPWRALTLVVEAGAAEAMSEALLAAGAHSVCLEDLERERPTLHAIIATGEDAGGLVARAADAAGLPRAPQFTSAELADDDWVLKSQAQFAPVEIGGRLWVGATWHEPPAGRVVVRLDPGLAFGTGSHPSTRLVLDFLEKTISGGERVLDYGCGSGILAIAAAKLGAARVDGVDVDPQALETACANARRNGVELRATFPEALPAGSYDIVAANILAQPLVVLAPVLAARTRPGGSIALAGILEAQAAEVAAAYAPWFDARTRALHDDWALVAGVRR